MGPSKLRFDLRFAAAGMTVVDAAHRVGGYSPSTPTPLILSLSKDESHKARRGDMILRQARDKGADAAKVPRQPVPLFGGRPPEAYRFNCNAP
jgi:hypothetical protein